MGKNVNILNKINANIIIRKMNRINRNRNKERKRYVSLEKYVIIL